jgi:hypothetical protein
MASNGGSITAKITGIVKEFNRSPSYGGKHLTPAKPDRFDLVFPHGILPKTIEDFISHQTIQREYLASAILAALSTAIGNSASLEVMPGYIVKCIFYMAIVAPPGASKSPALKKAFAAIERHDKILYESYLRLYDDFKRNLAEAERSKSQKPEKPAFPQIIVKDSTIEMVLKILSLNPVGCCLLADELSGFLNRMNQYKTGDEIQKWLELWSSASVLLQRITRDENKVEEPFCNIVGGIQPGVLASLSKADNEHNGFFHRFVFVYPEPQLKTSWQKVEVPRATLEAYDSVFNDLLAMRGEERVVYYLSDDANTTYASWFDSQNLTYNKSDNDQDKGIISKYQDYCLRFALLLQVVADGRNRKGLVSEESMKKAIHLTEYFFKNIKKALKILAPETPLDGLSEIHTSLFGSLPERFDAKTALGAGQLLGMKDSAIRMFLKRSVDKGIFSSTAHGQYAKNF